MVYAWSRAHCKGLHQDSDVDRVMEDTNNIPFVSIPSRTDLRRTSRPLWLGLVAVLLILLLLVTLPPATTAWTTRLGQRLSQQIQEFNEARSQTENSIQRMQAAQRGYLLTQQLPFLETYQTAAAELPAQVAQLRQLAPLVDPVIDKEVDDLAGQIERWRREGPERQLELIEQDNLAAAVAEVSTGQSQQRFDAAIEQLQLLRTEIARIEADLTARITSVRRFSAGLAMALGALGVTLGVYLARMFRNMARLAEGIEHERQRAEAAFVVAEEARATVQGQLDDSRRRNHQLRVLNHLTGTASVPLQSEARTEKVLQELMGSLDIAGTGVWRLNPALRRLELVSDKGFSGAESRQIIPLDSPNLIAKTMADSRPRIIEDVTADVAVEPQSFEGMSLAAGTRSIVTTPLHGRSGPIGVLALASSTPEHFRSADYDYYVTLGSQAGLMIENAELYETVIDERQRLQVIFEQSPEGIIFAEAESGAVVLANQAARALMGDPLPPGALPSPAVEARLYRPSGEPLQAEQAPLSRALAGEPSIGVEIAIEQEDGRRTPVLFNAVPLRDPAGHLRGAVAVFQDLSHFREVERLKSDFVGMVSHELRTPLTAIQGCTQALLRGPTGADPQRHREFLEIIETQSARLNELIDNLLNLSQLEAGSLRLRRAPLQPARLIRSIARQAGERLHGVTVQVELPHSLPTISADQYRVEQVLLNLLDNARKFSPASGVITVRAEAQPEVILFSVRDQGPGIPPEDRERIFERFFQSSPPVDDAARGAGLGLAICRALIEAHGGRIWADSPAGAGARISFTLPRGLDSMEAAEPRPLGSAVQVAHDAAHVLVVDDEHAVRQMLEGTLRNAGYVVHAVTEGQAALEYLASAQPDLVVLDLMLPGQDGFTILQQLRDWSQVLVMILTASPEPDKVVRGLQLGADDYLTKPFNMNEFLARVDALLRRRSNGLEPNAPAILHHGPLLIDFARRRVEIDQQLVELTPTEYRLLTYLAQHPGQVLTHEQILKQVWGPEYGGESQYLWVHIGRLRQKIEADPKAPRMLVTERGVGYRFAALQ